MTHGVRRAFLSSSSCRLVRRHITTHSSWVTRAHTDVDYRTRVADTAKNPCIFHAGPQARTGAVCVHGSWSWIAMYAERRRSTPHRLGTMATTRACKCVRVRVCVCVCNLTMTKKRETRKKENDNKKMSPSSSRRQQQQQDDGLAKVRINYMSTTPARPQAAPARPIAPRPRPPPRPHPAAATAAPAAATLRRGPPRASPPPASAGSPPPSFRPPSRSSSGA